MDRNYPLRVVGAMFAAVVLVPDHDNALIEFIGYAVLFTGFVLLTSPSREVKQ